MDEARPPQVKHAKLRYDTEIDGKWIRAGSSVRIVGQTSGASEVEVVVDGQTIRELLLHDWMIFPVGEEPVSDENLRRRPTIEAHIRAVKDAYKQGLTDAEAQSFTSWSYDDAWAASESRTLLAQCWSDAVNAMDRQDAAEVS